MTALLLALALLADPLALTPSPPGAPSPAPVEARPSPEAPPSPETPPSPVWPSPPADTGYELGSGDLLEVVVFDNPDLSRSATVQTDGTISLPLVGDIPVAGLTPAAAEARITALLGDKYLVNPQVDLAIKEYRSQFVSVMGEVGSPGRKALKGPTRLLDLLVDAGGLASSASGEVVLTRPGGFPDGSVALRARLGSGPVSALDQLVLDQALRAGDIITVLPKHFVTVDGEVARPARYPLERDLTLTGAISMAGGITRYGSNRVRILKAQPGEGAAVPVVEVDIKAVRRGRVADPPLEPGDHVTVPRRVF